MSSDTHRFPILDDFSDKAEAGNPVDDAPFKPLFTASEPVFTLKALQEPQADPEKEQLAALELAQARQQLQNGINEGRAEGRLLAQKELTHDLENFLEARKRLSSQVDQASRQTALQIVRLSVAISRAILGGDMEFDAARLDPLTTALRLALERAAHATLNLSHRDLDLMEEIARASGSAELGATPGLTIRAVHDLPSGDFQLNCTGLDAHNLTESTLKDLSAILDELTSDFTQV